MKFEVNNDINSKLSLCQEDITKTNVDAAVNPTSETLSSGGGFDGAVHKAAWPWSCS